MNKNIGFIGAGNMASCLIGGMIDNGYDNQLIRASEPDDTQRKKASSLGIEVVSDNYQIAQWADILIFAVKPQMLKPVVEEISSIVQEKQPLLVSIAAGIRNNSINRWLGADHAIIRVMPNTPALINQGMSALCANDKTSDDQKQSTEAILQSVGKTVWLEHEDTMDLVTAISGSGPAYFFLFMEAMIRAATEYGMDGETAKTLVTQTALGATMMATESEFNPEELRKQVTSPGGTTEQAIKAFNEGGLSQLVEKAITAAAKRSVELSEQLGGDSS